MKGRKKMPKKTSGLMLTIAILAIGVQDIGGGAASPALADIMAAMPDVAPATVMMISTLPQVFQVVLSIFYGKLERIFKIRTMFFIASALFLVGGVVPFWLNDIGPILVCRGILGLAVGIFLPMGVSVINHVYYEDPVKRNRMLGLNVTVACFGGMAFQMVGGYLAKIDWHYCFLAYFSAVIVFLIVFFFLPEPEKRSAQEQEKVQLPAIVYGYVVVYLIVNCILMSIVNNNDVAIVGNGFGDAASAGISLTLYTFGGFLGGIIFGNLVKGLKGFTLSFGYLLSTVGFALAFFSVNLLMIILGTFLVGLGMGIIIPGTYGKITDAAGPIAAATGLGLAAACQGLGQFAQPLVYAPVLNVVGGEGKPAFAVSAVVFAVILVLSLIASGFGAKKKSATINAK